MVIEKSSDHSAIGSKRFWLITSILFTLAVALRWIRLDLMMFRYDQAAIAFRAMETFRSGLPFTGIVNSLGFHNSPGYVWTVLPAFLVTPDPRIATALHGLLAATMVYPLAMLGRRYRSDWLLWLPAVFAAFLPASVFAGRNLWAQFLLPVIVSWSLLCIDSVLDPSRSWADRRRNAAIALALLTWGVSTHFSAAALFFVATGFIVVAFARRWRDLAIASIPAVIIGLTILPSLFDAYDHFTNPRKTPQFAAEFEAILPDPLPWYVRLPDSVAWSFMNDSLEPVIGIQKYLSRIPLALISTYDGVVLLLLIAGAAFALLVLIKSRKQPWSTAPPVRRLATLLLALIFLPAVAGGFLVPRVNAGYYIGSLPAGWLLILLLPPLNGRLQYLGRIGLVTLAAGGLLIFALFLNALAKKGYIPGPYYLTYGRQAEVVRYIATHNIPVTRVSHLSGDWYEQSYNYIHTYLEKPSGLASSDAKQYAIIEDKNVRPDQPKRLEVFWALGPVEFGTVGVKLMPSRGAAETFIWNYYELPLE